MIDSIGWTLIHAGWQASIIAALVACALRLTRHATASARYVIALAGLALTIAAPIATTVAASRQPTAIELIATPRMPSMRRAGAVPAIQVLSQSRESRMRLGGTSVDAVLPWVVAAWLLGIAGLSARVLSGVVTVRRLSRHGASTVDARVGATAAGIASRLGIRSAFRLLQSAHVDVPMVVGWVKPSVLVPIGLLTSIAPAELEMLLAHELAHIRRYDTVVNLAQTIVETLLFFHPAVWWISARVREEREHCCDDMAIASCGNDRHGYGALLLRLEESRSTAALAVAATDGPLLRRVQRIVRARPARVDLGATWFAGVATMLPVLFILPLSGPSISATRERVAPIALSSTQTVTQTAPRQQPPSASVVQPSSRSTTMRRSSVLAAAAALTVAATQIAAQVSPNLSGRWILIPDPTNPTGDWSDGRELAIEQTDETLSIVHDGATITFHVEQSDSRSVVTKGPVRVSFAGFELAIGPTADSAYIKGSWQGATFNVSTPLSDKIRPAFGMMTFSLDAGELIVQTDIPATASQPAKHIVQRFRRA